MQKTTVKKLKRFLLFTGISAAVLAAAGALFVWYCNHTVLNCAQYCYDDISKVPQTDTALLLGAAKITPAGNPNLYFQARVDAAAQLYHAGRIKHILISGDNSRKNYNEPEDMKNALLERGVPETAMTLDFAGFRTLDSVVRAKNVFSRKKFLIITQRGHAERAVYIARKHDIDAAAFYAAEPVKYPHLLKRNRSREKFARTAAWLDVNILRRKPKFPR